LRRDDGHNLAAGIKGDYAGIHFKFLRGNGEGFPCIGMNDKCIDASISNALPSFLASSNYGSNYGGVHRQVWDKNLLITQNAHKVGSVLDAPHTLAEGRRTDKHGRAAPGARFAQNRSVRIGTGTEPPHPPAPAARCELRQLALHKTPARVCRC
jgi:hypothetical protein